MYQSPLRDPVLAIFLLSIVIAIAVAFSPDPAHRMEVSDIPEYYAASSLTLRGRGAGVYDPTVMCAAEQKLFPALNGRCIPLFCPPPALIWLSPISLIPLNAIIVAWTGLLSLALTASLLLIADFASLSKRQTLYLSLLVAISGPTFEALKTGQIAPFLLLALVLALRALKSNRELLSGAVASVLILKPHLLVPFCAAMLGAGRIRMLLCLSGLGLLVTGVELAIIGTEGFSNFWHYLSASMNQGGVNVGTTLRAQLMRLLPGDPAMVNTISLIMFIGACVFVAMMANRIRDRADWLDIIVCASLPLTLVFSLHAFPYDLLLMTPAIACWLKLRPLAPFSNRWRMGLLTAGCLAIATLLMPLYLVVHYDMVLHGAVINPLFVAMVVITALAMIPLFAPTRNGPVANT